MALYRRTKYEEVGGFRATEPPRAYRKEVHRQDMCYTSTGRRIPMPYSCTHASIKNLSDSVLPNGNPYGPSPDALNSQGGSSTFGSPTVSTAFTAAQNVAYLKMVEKVRGERVALSTALIEGREALEMIVNRSGQMTRAFKHLARGRFWLFLAELRITNALPKHHGMKWNRPKDASGLWLEYHFGWSPLLADIGGAISILQDRPALWAQRFRTVGVQKWNHNYRQPGSGTVIVATGPIEVGVRYQLTAVIENPNYHLANQLGFTNPGTVIWESVPFSFLIDWFYPVGNFLASANDFYGVKRRDAFHTRRYKAKVTSKLSTTPHSSFTLEYVRMDRVMGNIDFIPQSVFKRLSFSRAATAVSLLVQVFKGKLA